jgi:hypothetical protein
MDLLSFLGIGGRGKLTSKTSQTPEPTKEVQKNELELSLDIEEAMKKAMELVATITPMSNIDKMEEPVELLLIKLNFVNQSCISLKSISAKDASSESTEKSLNESQDLAKLIEEAATFSGVMANAVKKNWKLVRRNFVPSSGAYVFADGLGNKLKKLQEITTSLKNSAQKLQQLKAK